MAKEVLNGNLLIELEEAVTTLANGMSVQEQRGKKDIAHGIVRYSGCDGISEGNRVWFPFYAGLAFPLDGEMLMAVSESDVIMVEKGI